MGVSECRIDFGPWTKKRQNRDIEDAKVAWREYKQLKKRALKQAESKGPAKAISRNTTKKKHQREG
jgi:hypothetical protein